MVRPLGYVAGGIIALIEFLEEHGRAIRADFRSHYGIYLGDLFTGKMSWTEFRDLLEELPDGCRTDISVDGPGALWNINEELLASIIDVLQVANYQRAQGKGKKPKPVNRPMRKSAEGQYRQRGDEYKSKQELYEEQVARKQQQSNDDQALTQEEFDRILFGV